MTATMPDLATAALALAAALAVVYVAMLNHQLKATPPALRALSPHRWTPAEIQAAYARVQRHPITAASVPAAKVPPRPDDARRYIVTGGCGLVGGCIVLQLLERGHPPSAIRIVDFHPPHRADMLVGRAAAVPFFRADIADAAATAAAFTAPWPDADADAAAHRPLTVFHTAAVIVAAARSELVMGLCERVNVRGTANVVAAARAAAADVLVATSSASIAVKPVRFWRRWPWRAPAHYWQVLDEADFFRPLQRHDQFYANYPASKARAERIVCAANGAAMRTGCIRPGNGVYGHPTDNIVGAPLNMQIYPQWVGHTVQSFAHGINCAVAHLQLEAILAQRGSHTAPQAARPFCISDPGAPATYGDVYTLIATLAGTPFRAPPLPPAPMLLLAYAVEFYNLLPARAPWLRRVLPRLPTKAAYLEPALFSICTHLVGDGSAAARPVAEGGLAYEGVVGTLDGMCQELLEWNRAQEEHAAKGAARRRRWGAGWLFGRRAVKYYTTSVSLAEEIQRLVGVGGESDDR